MRTLTKTTKAKAAKQATTTRVLSVEKKAVTTVTNFIAVTFEAPKAIAEALEVPGKYTRVASAEIGDWLERRIREWAHSRTNDGERDRPRKSYLESALKMPLDSKINTLIHADEWDKINTVCNALSITPAEWLLASAAYNAELEIRRKQAA